ncbi:MAG: outer membrane beta-barrel protein [Gammaproteobacteria bacterium]
MSKSFTVLMALVFTTPMVAVAGPYVGIGAGGARTESSLAGLRKGDLNLVPNVATDVAAIGSDPDFHGTDVSFDITAGWKFGKHLAVEVGYTDFGVATQNYVLPEACAGSFGCQSREWTAKVEMSGARAFVIGSVPLTDNVEAYLKLGAIRWDASYDGFERNREFVPAPQIGTRNDPVSFDNSGTDLAAGMGVTLKTASPFSLRVDFNYYDVGTTDLIWNAQLMAVYTF